MFSVSHHPTVMARNVGVPDVILSGERFPIYQLADAASQGVHTEHARLVLWRHLIICVTLVFQNFLKGRGDMDLLTGGAKMCWWGFYLCLHEEALQGHAGGDARCVRNRVELKPRGGNAISSCFSSNRQCWHHWYRFSFTLGFCCYDLSSCFIRCAIFPFYVKMFSSSWSVATFNCNGVTQTYLHLFTNISLSTALSFEDITLWNQQQICSIFVFIFCYFQFLATVLLLLASIFLLLPFSLHFTTFYLLACCFFPAVDRVLLFGGFS